MKIEAAPTFFESLKRLSGFNSKLRNIRSWFHYRLKKDFLHLLKVVLQSYPWDCTFLYYIEKAKIEEMRKYHERNNSFVDCDIVIRDMKICENLIDIFTENKELFYYDGDIVFNKNENGDYTMETTPDFKYNCLVKVNLKNIKRFVDNEKNYKYYIENPHELYILKAKHLYHKIRNERDFTWWD